MRLMDLKNRAKKHPDARVKRAETVTYNSVKYANSKAAKPASPPRTHRAPT